MTTTGTGTPAGGDELPPPFPAVVRDSASADFFDAAARGELLVQRSGAGVVLGPEARTCPVSGSTDLEPHVAAGTGRLVSWAVVHRAPLPVLAGAVPYVTAMVELDEGPWLLVRLVDADPASLRVGDAVRVDVIRSGGPQAPGEMVPVFRPVPALDGATP